MSKTENQESPTGSSSADPIVRDWNVRFCAEFVYEDATADQALAAEHLVKAALALGGFILTDFIGKIAPITPRASTTSEASPASGSPAVARVEGTRND